jgi:hypothetical protein
MADAAAASFIGSGGGVSGVWYDELQRVETEKQNTSIDLNDEEREKINELRKKIYPERKENV